MSLIKIASLWENEKDGNIYFSGTLGDAKILIFKNNSRRDGRNDPTHQIFIAEKNKAERQEKVENTYASRAIYNNTPGVRAPVSFDDDDIAF